MLHFLTPIVKWSMAALLAGSTADSISSYGQPELNPLLSANGQFNSRSVGVKFGIVGGVIVGETLLLHHHPEMGKTITIVNFAGAGVTGGVAVRNWRMR